jgi:hypothetical protein
VNPLIERYVYDVVRRLPEREREEVRAELVSNIEAMLPPDAKEADVIKVLESLGAPSKMAEQYRADKRFLISPAVFDDYIMVLKIVGSVLFGVILFASVIGAGVQQAQNPSLLGFITGFFASFGSGIFTAAFSAFTWVTVGFVLYEHFGRQQQKSWTVKELPRIPKAQKRIPPSASVVEMVFTLAFSAVWIVVILRYAHYIAWYENGVPTVPFFNIAVLTSLVPFFIALALFSLAVSAAKIVHGAWTYSIAALNAVHKIADALFVGYFLNAAGVFNASFIEKMAGLLNVGTNTVADGFAMGFLVITVLVAIGCIADTATGFYKAYKNAKAA